MLEALARWWRRSSGKTAGTAAGAGAAAPGGVDEVDLVEQARREWHAARALFDNVSDPELIDHAIHRMTAAERRYMFLIKEARRSGITEDGLGQLLADPRCAGTTAIPEGAGVVPEGPGAVTDQQRPA